MEEQELSTISDEALEDQAFESGFDESIATPEIGEAQAPSIEETQAAIEEAQIQQAIEDNPALTEAQVRELFEHNNQKIYGKFGEVQRELNRFKALAEQLSTQGNTAQPVAITPEAFSNMREEFGEDFAAALAKDLSNLPLGSAAAQSAISQEQIDLILSQKVEQLKNEFEIKYVEQQHPDWQEVAQSDDFNNWKSQLPADVQDRLNNSWDSNFVSAALTAYKRDVQLYQQSLEEAEKLRQQQITQKNKKLQSAVMPSSSGGSSDDYEDDFEAGFNGA